MNEACLHLSQDESKAPNELYWEGSSLEIFVPGMDNSQICKCSLVCRVCKMTPSCLALCEASIYYIVSQNPKMTCAAMHFGTHDYLVADGESREANSEIHEIVKAHVS